MILDHVRSEDSGRTARTISPDQSDAYFKHEGWITDQYPKFGTLDAYLVPTERIRSLLGV